MKVDHGSTHALKLFKNTYNSWRILEDNFIIGDIRYQVRDKIYVNYLIPYKKPYQYHNYNKFFSKLRISVAHAIRKLKKFNVIEGQNRDRRMRFEIRIIL